MLMLTDTDYRYIHFKQFHYPVFASTKTRMRVARCALRVARLAGVVLRTIISVIFALVLRRKNAGAGGGGGGGRSLVQIPRFVRPF